MKIFIDIGHPAHVHYFRNFIKIMQKKKYDFLIISRDKECTIELLKNFNIKFVSRGKGKNSLFGKIIYLFKANWIIYNLCLKFKPDVFISMASPYAAQVSWLFKKPSFTFDDTEHATISRKFYKFFTNKIFTPYCFNKELGSKQIYFKSFMELFYLHPKYFKKDVRIFKKLNLSNYSKFIILRFISWNANHDIGHSGLDIQTKRKLIELLKDKFNIFISSESELPDDFKKYRLNVPPECIHNVLAYSELFIGESATMAQECAMLGTPAIYVNSLDAGTLRELESKNLIYCFRNTNGVIMKVKELLKISDLKTKHKSISEMMIKNLIDPNEMLVSHIKKLKE